MLRSELSTFSFYFGTQAEGGVVDIVFFGKRDQDVAVAQLRQVEVHFDVSVQFEKLFQLQLIILQGSLGGHQLVVVAADLRFQLGEVA